MEGSIILNNVSVHKGFFTKTKLSTENQNRNPNDKPQENAKTYNLGSLNTHPGTSLMVQRLRLYAPGFDP